MQPTGKLASREPGLRFLSSVPQPHALSLSSDANEEIVVPCALTQGDQTHWSAFSSVSEPIAFTDVLVV